MLNTMRNRAATTKASTPSPCPPAPNALHAAHGRTPQGASPAERQRGANVHVLVPAHAGKCRQPNPARQQQIFKLSALALLPAAAGPTRAQSGTGRRASASPFENRAACLAPRATGRHRAADKRSARRLWPQVAALRYTEAAWLNTTGVGRPGPRPCALSMHTGTVFGVAFLTKLVDQSLSASSHQHQRNGP